MLDSHFWYIGIAMFAIASNVITMICAMKLWNLFKD